MKVYLDHSNITQNMHGASRNYRYVWDVSASCLGASETTPGPGQRGSRRSSIRLRGTPAPRLQRRLQRPIRQNSKGNKAGEYLVYPRVLRPLLSIMHCINGKKRLYIVD